MIVEGKYDKIKILSVADATVITTDGFGVFNNTEKRAVIRRLSENGVILLCDSDGAGKLIRSHLSGLIPPEKTYQLYVPQIKGKEKRKAKARRSKRIFFINTPPGICRAILPRNKGDFHIFFQKIIDFSKNVAIM